MGQMSISQCDFVEILYVPPANHVEVRIKCLAVERVLTYLYEVFCT
jgi:hypothetical protein